MKIRIEQIILEEHILVYSKYIKDTESQDEDGTDFEYDFESFITNLDGIQQTILRLYGELGLIRIMKHYANGAVENFGLEPVEYEENSSMFDKIRKLQIDLKTPVDNVLEIQSESEHSKTKIPTDDMYLLSGWIEALPVNDDLNVLKMVGTTTADNSPLIMERCKSIISKAYPETDFEELRCYSFLINGVENNLAILPSSIYLISASEEEIVLYPGNEFQEKQQYLFRKFMSVKNVYKLKTSVIIEATIDKNAYYLLFNIAAAKFESKKIILGK